LLLRGQYQQSLGGYLYHLTGDRDLASDLTQDTFIKAYKALSATRPELAIRPWLFRIATNLAYDTLRRLRRIVWLPLSLVEHQASRDDVVAIEEHELVRLSLTSLRPDEQAVLILCLVEQQTYAEVAVTFGSSPDAIRKRLGRAKERFRMAYAARTGDIVS